MENKKLESAIKRSRFVEKKEFKLGNINCFITVNCHGEVGFYTDLDQHTEDTLTRVRWLEGKKPLTYGEVLRYVVCEIIQIDWIIKTEDKLHKKVFSYVVKYGVNENTIYDLISDNERDLDYKFYEFPQPTNMK